MTKRKRPVYSYAAADKMNHQLEYTNSAIETAATDEITCLINDFADALWDQGWNDISNFGLEVTRRAPTELTLGRLLISELLFDIEIEKA